MKKSPKISKTEAIYVMVLLVYLFNILKLDFNFGSVIYSSIKKTFQKLLQ